MVPQKASAERRSKGSISVILNAHTATQGQRCHVTGSTQCERQPVAHATRSALCSVQQNH
eukprot:567466-Rhodomonas_salina.1